MPLVTIPQQIDHLNKSERYIVKKLKLLYMSQKEIVYLYLEPTLSNLIPDFILIDPLRGVMVIEVKAWDINYIVKVNPKSVLTIKNEELENPAYKARRYFNTLQNILKSNPLLRDKNNTLTFNLASLLIFTNLKQADILLNSLDDFFKYYPVRVFFKEDLATLRLDKLFKTKKAINKELIDAIRTTIFPEIEIKAKIEDEKEQEIIALDIEQERFAKSIPFGHYMVTGLPGSGKTVVLLSRAIHLAKIFPEWKILIVTYNKLLKSQLEKKIEAIKADLEVLGLEITNIEIATFHQKAYQLAKVNAKDYEDKEQFWREIIVTKALSKAKASYDAILVDEYQDFYKEWFELLIAMTKEFQYGEKLLKNIFLAGDRLQSIYNPKDINWKQDIGLDMRGRSKLLKKSYRLQEEHIRVGLALLAKNKAYKEEIKKFYEIEELDVTLENKKSIELKEGDDEEIVALLKKLFKEYYYEDILLLAPNGERINFFKKALGETFAPYISSYKKQQINKATFTTYYSAKGIEAKVVVMVDAQEITERKLFYVGVTRASLKVIVCANSFKKNEITRELAEIVEQKEVSKSD